MRIKVEMEVEVRDFFDLEEVRKLINGELIESYDPIKKWSITKVEVPPHMSINSDDYFIKKDIENSKWWRRHIADFVPELEDSLAEHFNLQPKLNENDEIDDESPAIVLTDGKGLSLDIKLIETDEKGKPI